MRCPICGTSCKPEMVEDNLVPVYLPKCEKSDCALTSAINTTFQTKKDAITAWRWVAAEVASYTGAIK